MKIEITIITDNAAFEDNPYEVAEMLEELSKLWVDSPPGQWDDGRKLRDSNGQTAGFVSVSGA